MENSDSASPRSILFSRNLKTKLANRLAKNINELQLKE